MAKANNPDRGLHKYPDGKWGVYCFVGGKPYRKKVGSKTEAREWYHKVKRIDATGGQLDVDIGKRPVKTIGELLAHYIEHDASDTTAVNNAYWWIEHLGECLPKNLTADRLNSSLKAFGRGRKPATIHRLVHPLRRCLNLAVDRGDIDVQDNVFSKPKLIKLPKINNRRDPSWTPEQKRRLREVAGTDKWRFIDFALQTAVRQGDQLGLTRDDPDLMRGYIRLVDPKSGETHYVPLNKTASAIVVAQLEEHESRYVFPAPRGGRWSANNFRNRFWRPLFNEAGLSHLHWHDLRHLAASNLIAAGVDIYTVQRLLDHQSAETTSRYAHVRDEALQAAVGLLDGSGGARSVEDGLRNEIVRLKTEVADLRHENRRLKREVERLLKGTS